LAFFATSIWLMPDLCESRWWNSIVAKPPPRFQLAGSHGAIGESMFSPRRRRSFIVSSATGFLVKLATS
jgi:hypothetical protein